jgi:hypothetical protein
VEEVFVVRGVVDADKTVAVTAKVVTTTVTMQIHPSESGGEQQGFFSSALQVSRINYR